MLLDDKETGFRYFYDKMGFGPAELKEIPPAALIEKYRGKVPDRMLDYWQAYGFCSFGNGAETGRPPSYRSSVSDSLYVHDKKMHAAVVSFADPASSTDLY